MFEASQPKIAKSRTSEMPVATYSRTLGLEAIATRLELEALGRPSLLVFSWPGFGEDEGDGFRLAARFPEGLRVRCEHALDSECPTFGSERCKLSKTTFLAVAAITCQAFQAAFTSGMVRDELQSRSHPDRPLVC